jgi:D-alanyl-D-alanine carboxypeptidase (penicillin-binding protein 5/6)
MQTLSLPRAAKLFAAFAVAFTLIGGFPAAQASAATAVPQAHSKPGQTPVNALKPAKVPCPIASAPLPPGAKPIPKAPPPPARTTDSPAIGGEALATEGLLVPEGAAPLPRTLSTQAWVVADLDSGDILAACAPHVQYRPASTQKLLTVLAALPKVDLKQVVTITQEDLDFERGSSAVGLVKGGKYTVETILLGLLLNSGNDAANVIARLGGGTEGVAGTLKRMNSEARRIGALDTTAVTPSGLDAPGQFTSAYDLALIARAAFDLPAFRKAVATQRAVIPAQPPKYPAFQIQNDNRLLTNYQGAIGGKTGFTDDARHTYVGVAKRGDRRLAVTLLRGENRPQRLWQQGAALLDWGFALPRDAEPVGRLVSEDEVRPDQRRAPQQPGGKAAALAGPPGRLSFNRVQSIGLALGAGTVGFALLTAGWMALRWRREQARRRALRGGQAWF